MQINHHVVVVCGPHSGALAHRLAHCQSSVLPPALPAVPQLHHWPDMAAAPIRRHYAAMAWAPEPAAGEALRAWQRGLTGYPMVDAGKQDSARASTHMQAAPAASGACLQGCLHTH